MIKPVLSVKATKSGWADLRARVLQLDRRRLQVGVLGGRSEHGDDLVDVAAAHELGTSTVPARSFVGATVRDQRREIASRLASLSAAEIHSEASGVELAALGLWLSLQMKLRIQATDIPPPLKPETMRRKAAGGYVHPDKPLVRTGAMVAAISWRVS